MSKLVAGPWVGEFGWELFNWQGRVRYLADFYDEVVVGCRENSKYLYDDFASDFWFIDTGDKDTENNMCHGYEDCDTEKFRNGVHDYINPQHLSFYLDKGVPTIGDKKQKFVRLGEECNLFKNRKTIILHARNTNKCNTGDRDWPIEKWEELVKLIGNRYEIISMGSAEQSMHIEGTQDLRGCALKTMCGIINESKCIIGPSSGPMHLGSLCGTPQIVWSGHERNKYRYEELWNPHQTKVIYLGDEGWQPTVEYVYKHIKQYLFDTNDNFKI